MAGWIKVERDITKHWLWSDKPFSKGQAWIDILLLANHKDNKFLLGSEMVEVEQGEFITSEVKLMDRWGWSKTKLRNFLKLLEKEEMIIKKSDNKKTTLKVVNYCIYQHLETAKELQKDQEKTGERPVEDTNKNDKKEKNEKKKDNSQISNEIWKAYPNKKGKTKAIVYIDKLLKNNTKEDILKAISLYDREVKKDRLTGFNRMYQDGSTFFNKTVNDYLNIEEVKQEERKIIYGF